MDLLNYYRWGQESVLPCPFSLLPWRMIAFGAWWLSIIPENQICMCVLTHCILHRIPRKLLFFDKRPIRLTHNAQHKNFSHRSVAQSTDGRIITICASFNFVILQFNHLGFEGTISPVVWHRTRDANSEMSERWGHASDDSPESLRFILALWLIFYNPFYETRLYGWYLGSF